MSEYSTYIGSGVIVLVILGIMGLHRFIKLIQDHRTDRAVSKFSGVTEQIIKCPNCSEQLVAIAKEADARSVYKNLRYYNTNCPKCKVGLTVDTQLLEGQRVTQTGKR